MISLKVIVVILLVVLGLYWLFAHYEPFPFNHEQLGMAAHNIHRMIGVVFLVAAGLVWWKWKEKK